MYCTTALYVSIGIYRNNIQDDFRKVIWQAKSHELDLEFMGDKL